MYYTRGLEGLQGNSEKFILGEVGVAELGASVLLHEVGDCDSVVHAGDVFDEVVVARLVGDAAQTIVAPVIGSARDGEDVVVVHACIITGSKARCKTFL